MDPVNPAPAGNPQLTTHLLVSHKKNKNFHPCKVKLRKTKSKYKEAAISNLSQLGFIRASDLKAHPVTFFKNSGKRIVPFTRELILGSNMMALVELVKSDVLGFRLEFSFKNI